MPLFNCGINLRRYTVKWTIQLLSYVMCDGSGYHVSCRESMFIYILLVGRICRTFGLLSLTSPSHLRLSVPAYFSLPPLPPRFCHMKNKRKRLAAMIVQHACTWFHERCQYFINTIIANFYHRHHHYSTAPTPPPLPIIHVPFPLFAFYTHTRHF